MQLYDPDTIARLAQVRRPLFPSPCKPQETESFRPSPPTYPPEVLALLKELFRR